ncbi:hypothetical protein BDW62DRAFT_193012 [Aspergillus aurantiobrunneus]
MNHQSATMNHSSSPASELSPLQAHLNALSTLPLTTTIEAIHSLLPTLTPSITPTATRRQAKTRLCRVLAVAAILTRSSYRGSMKKRRFCSGRTSMTGFGEARRRLAGNIQGKRVGRGQVGSRWRGRREKRRGSRRL